jgi:peptide/nickel transport system permease protein
VLRYIIRRLVMTIPIMLLVAFLVFSLLYLAPGDPAAIIAGDQATPADLERIHRSLGLDRPFLVRFFEWLQHVITGDLGTSIFTNLPVSQMIEQRIEPTMSLLVMTLALSIVFAIPMGVLAAWKQGTLVDRGLMILSVLGFSTPVFVIGYLLAYVFGLRLDILPVQGFVPISDGVIPFLRSLLLPSVALSLVYAALITRVTRASMLEVISQDYIRTAKAKGLSWRKTLFVHALKNASIPIVTIIGIGFSTLIGGAVVTESVFALPGLGRLTVDAILRRDYPVIQGVVLFFSFMYVIVNLIVDIAYMLVDPRVRY